MFLSYDWEEISIVRVKSLKDAGRVKFGNNATREIKGYGMKKK